jgi:hypothetical protein
MIRVLTGVLLVAAMGLLTQAVAQANDPMRPPAFALHKYKLEKLKKNPPPVPLPTSQKEEQPWVLNSILYSKQRQHAVINNVLVRKGERIRGARLVRLTPESVRLVHKGKVIDLDLRSRYKSIRKSAGGKNL